MGYTYAKIDRILDAMENEGFEPSDISLLRTARNCCKTSRDWESMVRVVFVKSDKGGDLRRFQPSDLLRNLAAAFTNETE